MKSLSHLFRRAVGTKKKRQHPKTSRPLRTQTLEKRNLLAGDIVLQTNPFHNGLNAFDVNGDNIISSRDALNVVNELNAQSQSQGESNSGFRADVNNDGNITGIDALLVINAMQEGPQETGEVLELFVTARDVDDNPLTVTDGAVSVDVNEEFLLEVAFDDLRRLDQALGVFQLYADLGVSQGGILEPVLRENQRFDFDSTATNLDPANGVVTTGDVVFSIEGSDVTHSATLEEFTFNRQGEFRDALAEFGFSPDQFDVSQPLNAGGRAIIDVFFSAPEFADVDQPNIIVTANTTDPLPVTFTEFAPLDDSGNVNADAVPFNLNTFSRTFDDDDFINQLIRSEFDPATGFQVVGGFAGRIPAGGGGIPELLGGEPFAEPFDLFSLPVRLTQPVNNFEVNVRPTTDPLTSPEAVLVFGSNDPVSDDLILLDTDAVVTINAIGDQVNQAPDAGLPQNISLQVTDASQTVNLLDNASDPDGDNVTLQSLTLSSGDDSGVTISGSNVTVDPSVYTSNQTIVYDYVVTDGSLTDTNTLTISITGVNGSPTINPINATFAENVSGIQNVGLLTGASDPDGSTVTLVPGSVTLQSGDATGVVINEASNRLEVTPSAYVDLLAAGQTESVVYTYQVTDGTDQVVNTATVTITGLDPDLPVDAGEPIVLNFDEDESTRIVDLLSNASGSNLSVNSIALVSGDNRGITVSGNTLTVEPNDYNFLRVGVSRRIEYSFNVTDGSQTDSGSAVITILGRNDQPTISSGVAETVSTEDSPRTVDLLQNASDPDFGSTLSVEGTSVVLQGNTAGVSFNGLNGLSVDPAQYTLADGQSIDVTATYNIIDGDGGSVASNATITIVGGSLNQGPVLGITPLTATFSEASAPQEIDLLQGATDPDGDTLSIANFDSVVGGTSLSGTTLTVTPSFFSSLNNGESENLNFTYNIVDENGGSLQQTLNVTITGVTDNTNTNNPPVVSNGIAQTISEDAAPATISLLQFASDPDAGDTIGVVSNSVVISNDPNGAVTVDGNSLEVNPNAYNGLDAGESQVISVAYDITDDSGATVAQTAVITIVGANDGPNPPTTIFGSLFIDEMTPTRNGEMDAGEDGLAGVVVRLTSSGTQNTGGIEVDRVVLTDIRGNYTFGNVQPGSYEIEYEIPENVVYLGETRFDFEASAEGGNVSLNFAALGLSGGLNNLDILSSSFLANNGLVSDMSDQGRQGGSVALGEDGAQELLVANAGFDGVRFAELALNGTQDAALLTILMEDGTVQTAQLSQDFFVVSNDGTAVQFFGGIEDFDFADSPSELLAQEFIGYLDAIDAILANG